MGLLLVGIVFLNVSLLGLNSGIAVTADQAAELRHQNADLRLEVAKLGSSERIQRVAEARGFMMPAPGKVTYLDADPEAHGRTAARALDKAGTGTASAEAPDVAVAPAAAVAPEVAGATPELTGETPGTAGAAPTASPPSGTPAAPLAGASAPSLDGTPPAPSVVGTPPAPSAG